MQNTKTLIGLGFTESANGSWEKKGQHQTFIATVEENNLPVYVQLYIKSQTIDNRPFSHNKGKHFLNTVKDCCTNGSIERAIIKYDLPFERLQPAIGGIYIVN